jgi:hypothetical protein
MFSWRDHRRVAGRVDLGDLQRHLCMDDAGQAEGQGKGGNEQLVFEVHDTLHLVFVGVQRCE